MDSLSVFLLSLKSFERVKVRVVQAESAILEFTEILLGSPSSLLLNRKDGCSSGETTVGGGGGGATEDDSLLEGEITGLTEAIQQLKLLVESVEKKLLLRRRKSSSGGFRNAPATAPAGSKYSEESLITRSAGSLNNDTNELSLSEYPDIKVEVDEDDFIISPRSPSFLDDFNDEDVNDGESAAQEFYIPLSPEVTPPTNTATNQMDCSSRSAKIVSQPFCPLSRKMKNPQLKSMRKILDEDKGNVFPSAAVASMNDDNKLQQTVKISVTRLEGMNLDLDSSKVESEETTGHRGNKRAASMKAIQNLSQMQPRSDEDSNSSEDFKDEEWEGDAMEEEEDEESSSELDEAEDVKPEINCTPSSSSYERKTRKPWGVAEKKFPCHLCDKAFRSKQYLRIHLRTRHEVSPSNNETTNCTTPKTQAQPIRRKRRPPSVPPKSWGTSETKFPCHICDMVYRSKEYLQRHLKDHENCLTTSSFLVCSKCSEEFVHGRHLRRHISLTHPELCVSCPQCNKLYYSEDSLKTHMTIKHKIQRNISVKKRTQKDPHFNATTSKRIRNNPVTKTCPFCLKTQTFKYSTLYYFHANKCILSYGNPECPVTGPWRCQKPECSEIDPFSDLQKFKSHMKEGNSHPPDPPNPVETDSTKKRIFRFFRCPTCSKSIESVDFSSHIKQCLCGGDENQPSHEMPTPCPICPEKEYKSLKCLVEHLKSHHQDQSFLCPQCNKSFPSERRMRFHLTNFHRTDKPYLCSQCPATFKWRMGLMIHLQNTHNSDRLPRILCEFCAQSFKNNYSLARHMREVHQGLRPHKCELCYKSFKTRSHLVYHKATHANPNGKKRSLNKPKLVPTYRDTFWTTKEKEKRLSEEMNEDSRE